MLETFGWIGSILAIVGATLNARCLRIGFFFYMASNIILVSVGYCKHEMYNVTLFSIFLVIAIYGYVVWGKKRPGDSGGSHG